MRPSTAEMEVDLAIDFDSKNFDSDSVYAETMKKQVRGVIWKLVVLIYILFFLNRNEDQKRN